MDATGDLGMLPSEYKGGIHDAKHESVRVGTFIASVDQFAAVNGARRPSQMRHQLKCELGMLHVDQDHLRSILDQHGHVPARVIIQVHDRSRPGRCTNA
jgi:hypothetical protein